MDKWKDVGEIWSDIVGFPCYMVSTEGRVKNLFSGVILKPQNNGNGYLKVSLRCEGKTYQRYIHRLVAEHFCPCAHSAYIEVDHLDRDKTNNCADNLRWVTPSENQSNYAGKSRYTIPRGRMRLLTDSDKVSILELHNKGKSTVEIGRELGIKRQTVHSFLKRTI